MSRIGKKAITVPGGVTVSIKDGDVQVAGPLGKLGWRVPEGISVSSDTAAKAVLVENPGDAKRLRALHGLSRALIANMVQGVSKGFERRLLIYGTGYGCNLAGKTLQLNAGFMGRGGKNKYQFSLDVPAGVEVKIEVPTARGETDPAKLSVSGCDKQVVGQFAAVIRKVRPPEPYKGKGIRYEGENVRRKQGKALAGAR